MQITCTQFSQRFNENLFLGGVISIPLGINYCCKKCYQRKKKWWIWPNFHRILLSRRLMVTFDNETLKSGQDCQEMGQVWPGGRGLGTQQIPDQGWWQQQGIRSQQAVSHCQAPVPRVTHPAPRVMTLTTSPQCRPLPLRRSARSNLGVPKKRYSSSDYR